MSCMKQQTFQLHFQNNIFIVLINYTFYFHNFFLVLIGKYKIFNLKLYFNNLIFMSYH